MATVTASTAGSTTGSAWRTEQHSAVRDQALTGFPLQRYTARIANRLQVNNVEFESEARTVLLGSTRREMDVTEINDLLMATESITTCEGKLRRAEKHCCVNWMDAHHTDSRQHD